MTTNDLLKDKDAVKLAVAFKKAAKEYNVSIADLTTEGHRIISQIDKNKCSLITGTHRIKRLITENAPEDEKDELCTLIESLCISGTPKTFMALAMAFFFAENGVLSENE